jgi:hypothetical protein
LVWTRLLVDGRMAGWMDGWVNAMKLIVLRRVQIVAESA